MAEKYAKQQQPAVCGKFRLEDMPQHVSALGLVTLIFDLESGMLGWSHQR